MEQPSDTQTYLALSGLDFDGYEVPAHTQGGLLRYVYNRYSPGSFGTAVLAGDHGRALNCADSANHRCLSEIERWVKDKLPANMHGSYDNVQEWIRGKG